MARLLPKDSPLVHAIRAHLLTRMMMGLHCISDEQLERKDAYQEQYGKYCMKLHEKYDKSFDYPKQHALRHSTADIRARVPILSIMTSSDAVREAMARIRMTLNQYDAEISDRIAALAKRADVSPANIEEMPDSAEDNHWRLGAPQNLVDSRYAMKNTPWISDATRNSFTSALRTFIREAFPEEPLRADGEDPIQIRPFQCIYLHYTSLENWTDCCDVLRCNPSFQVNHEERFDCVMINMDNDPLTFGRLLFLFQCHLPSGRTEEIALVRLFKKSTWRPKTFWKIAEFLKTAVLPSYCLVISCAVLI
ncbi:hypothetical protein C8F04DRAFT_1198019 [Mycena alexandri]|uniref:Uncharacterized protein n=1 Tax=Mycena alexandri TaxID=1745969 RepID=A0AAD6S179_9AGAR|nr:hypothetical protein C8F04DRAFT_1198019 [Mycena alexandri]